VVHDPFFKVRLRAIAKSHPNLLNQFLIHSEGWKATKASLNSATNGYALVLQKLGKFVCKCGG
jgi:hypothetical protein